MGLLPGILADYRRGASKDQCLWRVMPPKWSSTPLSTAGAALHGGRWNRPGVGALYLSERFDDLWPVATAWAEFQQDLGTRIGCLVPYEADLVRVADLTDPDTTAKVGMAPGDLMCAWKAIRADGGTPPTWPLVDRLLAEDVHAVRVPSAARPGGVNLVVYRLDGAPGRLVRAIDPDSSLPVDQASWPAVQGP
jgi:RES domain-containing protein